MLQSKSPIILVVDDDPHDLHLFRNILQTAEYTIRLASNGSDALRSIRVGLPDLIFLDITMPEMDGYIVCEQLKADERTQHIPIIFISARDAILDKVRAFNVGAVDYITKPFEATEILARMEVHLKLKHALEQLRQENIERQKAETALQQAHDTLEARVQARTAELSQANISLKELALRYRSLFEQSNDAVFILDLSGKHLDVNQRACDMLGYSPEEMITLSYKDLVVNDEQDQSTDILNRLLTGEKLPVYERRFRHKDGSLIYISVNAELVCDAIGNPLHIQSILRDITERVQTEQALRQSNRNLAEAQRIAHLGSWELDLISNELYWSDEIYRIFGLSPKEFENTYESFLDMVHPDDRDAVNTAYKDSQQHDTPYDIVHRIVRRSDGEMRYVRELCEHIKDETSRIIRSVGTVHDVTELVKTEAERTNLLIQIQANAERTRSIMDTVPQGIILLDSSYHIIVQNPIAHEQLPILAQRDETDAIITLGNQSLATILTSPPAGLWHEVTVTGIEKERYFGVIARPIERENAPINWVIVFREITEERQIQQRANTQSRLASIGQFSAGIAHDFNNMLSVILLNADMLKRYAKLDDQFQKKVDNIILKGHSASKLIQQILDYSRQTVMQRHVVDLNVILINEVAFISQILPENIQLTYEPLNKACLAYIDPTRIQQVLMNLIVNARDAMPAGGQIDIQMSCIEVTETNNPFHRLKSGSWISIAVQDTGTGIPPKLLPYIFEPFVTTKPVGKGTGLGLAQIFGIVKQHDGYIDVQTEVNKGTTFTIYLPEYTTVDAVQLVNVEMSGDVVAGHGETILIIEDVTELSEALAESLRNLGYKTVAYRNGKEALNNWDTKAIDLVLSDVVMPEMSGIAFLTAIRQQGAMQPCIFMTGHLMGEQQDLDLENLRKGGRVELLTKPVDFSNLQRLIAQVLEKQS